MTFALCLAALVLAAARVVRAARPRTWSGAAAMLGATVALQQATVVVVAATLFDLSRGSLVAGTAVLVAIELVATARRPLPSRLVPWRRAWAAARPGSAGAWLAVVAAGAAAVAVAVLATVQVVDQPTVRTAGSPRSGLAATVAEGAAWADAGHVPALAVSDHGRLRSATATTAWSTTLGGRGPAIGVAVGLVVLGGVAVGWAVGRFGGRGTVPFVVGAASIAAALAAFATEGPAGRVAVIVLAGAHLAVAAELVRSTRRPWSARRVAADPRSTTDPGPPFRLGHRPDRLVATLLLIGIGAVALAVSAPALLAVPVAAWAWRRVPARRWTAAAPAVPIHRSAAGPALAPSTSA